MKKIAFTISLMTLISFHALTQSINTSLSNLYSYPGEQIVVPVEVNNFNGVASISLVLSYDNSVLTFTGIQNVNSNLTGSFMTNAMPGGDGQQLILSWFALVPANIGIGTMMELKFNYSGGSTVLRWDTLTFGNCQYANLMGDVLSAQFTNGSVNPVSPNLTYSSQITAIPSTEVYLPITVASFNNVAEIHLSLNHNHSVISYQSLEYTNPLISNSSVSVTNGGDIVHINWQSPQAINIGDDTLFILRFHYNGGTSLLDWDTIAPGANYYKDAGGNVLPGTFVGGSINPALIQVGINSASICNGGDVSLPVSVVGANDIKAFSLKLNYNNAVMNYNSFQNLNTALANGTFTINDNNGVLQIDWNSNTPVDIGNAEVFKLNFHTIVNNGGLSDMNWDNVSAFHDPNGNSFPLNLVGGSILVTPFINIGDDQEVCVYHTTTLFAGALFASYLWSNGDTTSSIVVDSTMGSGLYSVTVTDVNGCSGYDEVNVTFVPCTGLNEVESEETQINIFPNPAVNGVVSINIKNLNEEAVLSIIDLTGRLIVTKNISNLNGKVITEEIGLQVKNGLYFLKVQTSGQSFIERLVVN